MLTNVSMVAVLLQTPVSVSLAGEDPTAPVVSFHLLLPVLGPFQCVVLYFGWIITDPVLGLLVKAFVLSCEITVSVLIFFFIYLKTVLPCSSTKCLDLFCSQKHSEKYRS